MYMSEREIVLDFRMARNKREQIKILADLNVCTPAEIQDVLVSAGEQLPPKRKRRGGRKKAVTA